MSGLIYVEERLDYARKADDFGVFVESGDIALGIGPHSRLEYAGDVVKQSGKELRPRPRDDYVIHKLKSFIGPISVQHHNFRRRGTMNLDLLII